MQVQVDCGDYYRFQELRMSKRNIAGFVLGVGLILTACGGSHKEALQSGAEPASEVELRRLLLSDLAARGIDPAKAASKAPTGAVSPTLLYQLFFGSGEPSVETPQSVSFGVFTTIAGDCDGNGQVNI